MAPKDIENQTRHIIRCLFEEDESIQDKGKTEPDGAEGDGELSCKGLPQHQGFPSDRRIIYPQGPGPEEELLGSGLTFPPRPKIIDAGVIIVGASRREDAFDPVLIADKLRELGDDYDEKVIQPLMNNVRQAAADQMVRAFGDSVDSLCESWVGRAAEVASEKQLLKASITLGLYVKTKCPDMARAVQGAMADFLNVRLGSWVAQQGGWDEVASN